MTLEEKIIIAGSGGQGILFLGRVIAESAVRQGKYAASIDSHGPESRGGTSKSQVIVSNEEIGLPIIDYPNVLIIFNQESMDKFEPELKENGLLLYNSSLIEREFQRTDIKEVAVPFTEIAEKLGDKQVLNMVALGAYYELKKTIDLEVVLKKTLPMLLTGEKAAYIPLNKKAIQAGIDYIKGNVNN